MPVAVLQPRQVSLVCLLAALVALPGCGGTPEGTVQGKVTHKGAPLTAGVVNFQSDKGHAATADLDSSGAFKLSGAVPVGNYKVYVTPPTPKQLPPGTPPEPPVQFTLPPKLQDPAQTPITKEIKAGPNDLTIDLPE
jgi:hypothetical protein